MRSVRPLTHSSGLKSCRGNAETCKLTADLEAVLHVYVGARVMFHRNIDTSQRLVNGAIGTVISISIKAHHIFVQFDNMSHIYNVEKVKSKFVVVVLESSSHWFWHLQWPYTSVKVFLWTVLWWTSLMNLSDEVFSPDMAYVALSHVKRLENLHLIAFKPQFIIVSSKTAGNKLVAADLLPKSPAASRTFCSTCATKMQTKTEWQCSVNFSF